MRISQFWLYSSSAFQLDSVHLQWLQSFVQVIYSSQWVLILFGWPGLLFLLLNFEFLLPFGAWKTFGCFRGLLDLNEGLLHFVKLFCYFLALFFLFKNEHLISQRFNGFLTFHQTHFDVFQFVIFLINLSVKFVDFFQKRIYLQILFQKNSFHWGNLLIRHIQISIGFLVVKRCLILFVFIANFKTLHMLFGVIIIDIIALFRWVSVCDEFLQHFDLAVLNHEIFLKTGLLFVKLLSFFFKWFVYIFKFLAPFLVQLLYFLLIIFLWNKLSQTFLPNFFFLDRLIQVYFFVVCWKHKMTIECFCHFSFIWWGRWLFHKVLLHRLYCSLAFNIEGKFCRTLWLLVFILILWNFNRKLSFVVSGIFSINVFIPWNCGIEIGFGFVTLNIEFFKLNYVHFFVFLDLVPRLMRFIMIWSFGFKWSFYVKLCKLFTSDRSVFILKGLILIVDWWSNRVLIVSKQRSLLGIFVWKLSRRGNLTMIILWQINDQWLFEFLHLRVAICFLVRF